jgi:penicillin amidase
MISARTFAAEAFSSMVMKAPRWLERMARLLLFLPVLVLLILVVGGTWLWFHFRASLPILEGEIAVAELTAPVRLERDRNGVPTIFAEQRTDAAFALGWLHAQDRFFQMDLTRRLGAGELSELIGARALNYDSLLRVHPGRAIAERALEALPEAHRKLLQRYAAGVNAGLAELEAAPPEYLLPGAEIRPWEPVDSLLVALSMWFDLQDEFGAYDYSRAILRESLPPEVGEYLLAARVSTEAPLDGVTGPAPEIPWKAWTEAVRAVTQADSLSLPTELAEPGSNAWASRHTADGRAIVANDMHLALRVPNTWYRASLRLAGEDAREVDGATLPGLPLWIVGSNRKVAWGFTNSYIDATDLVHLELNPEDENQYRTPEGWEAFTVRTETIQASGGETKVHEVRETRWGPVRVSPDGTPYATVWLGAQPWAWNLELMGLETAENLDGALAIFQRSGMPPQNAVVVDRQGDLAWTIAGALPDRNGIEGFLPLDAAQWGEGWSGRLAPLRYPVVRHGANGVIWSANQRMLGEANAVAMMGDGGYDGGSRASRIRDVLRSQEVDEDAMLSLQGDETVEAYERWRRLVLEFLTNREMPLTDQEKSVQALLSEWDGTAAAESTSYPAVRALAIGLETRARAQLLSPLGALAKKVRLNDALPLADVAYLCYAEKRDALAPEPVSGWNAVIAASIAELDPPIAQGKLAWGQLNRLEITHPLGNALPFLKRFFDFPALPVGGDYEAVKVLRGDFGSSERMVVSPGHEEEGFYHQPGGASGHFLSPYYRSGHSDWVDLVPSPFLPGRPVHQLLLVPSSD